MGTKNYVGTIASLIGSANDKHFTLDAVDTYSGACSVSGRC